MSNNRLCEMLGIRYPIIEGGMAYVGNGSLAAAVSNGGGLGQIGSAGRSIENFEDQIRIASELTDKPFAVNLPISEHKDNQPYINVIEKHKDKIKAISISSGNPIPFIEMFKDFGLVTIILTSQVKHAVKAEKAGADIIVCEGYEAGGHNGGAELTTFALVPQVAAAVRIPVVAAGGITNGSGLVAAMSLGADGVQIGTRFVASLECEAHENYKRLLIESQDDATVIMTRRIGGVIRVINNDFVKKAQKVDESSRTVEAILPYTRGTNNKIAAIDGNVENGWVSSGQGAGLIKEIMSAEVIISSIVEEANQKIAQFKELKI